MSQLLNQSELVHASHNSLALSRKYAGHFHGTQLQAAQSSLADVGYLLAKEDAKLAMQNIKPIQLSRIR